MLDQIFPQGEVVLRHFHFIIWPDYARWFGLIQFNFIKA